MCMLYSAWRFLIEFRAATPVPQWLGELSYSQVVSMALFVVRRDLDVPAPEPPARRGSERRPAAPSPGGRGGGASEDA